MPYRFSHDTYPCPYKDEVERLREVWAKTSAEGDRLRDKVERLREALREIAAGPYNGFEQCKAIARQALEGSEREPSR